MRSRANEQAQAKCHFYSQFGISKVLGWQKIESCSMCFGWAAITDAVICNILFLSMSLYSICCFYKQTSSDHICRYVGPLVKVRGGWALFSFYFQSFTFHLGYSCRHLQQFMYFLLQLARFVKAAKQWFLTAEKLQ